jgi:hypothetical protein
MIKLKDAGERGGEITITCSPFDLLSLQEGLMFAINHFVHVRKSDPEYADALGFEPKEKDARANYREIERVLSDREEVLSAVSS